MEAKSQAQFVVDQLALRIGQLEVEKAVLLNQLEAKEVELRNHIIKEAEN